MWRVHIRKELLHSKKVYSPLMDIVLLGIYVEQEIKIQDCTPELRTQQVNYSLIMEDFVTSAFKNRDLTELNKYCMNLKSICLSDMSTGN